MLSEVVMEQKREGLLFVQLSVQNTPHVGDLGLHTSERFEEEVRVTLEEITHVDLCQAWLAFLDQIKLLLDDLLTVLECKLWESVHHLDHEARLDIISSLHVVEKTDIV